DGLPGSVIEHLEVEDRAAPAFLAALAENAVAMCPQRKLEVYLHLGRALGDQFVIAHPVAGAAPERPGHGREQRRLARAVLPGQAGQLDAAKIEDWRLVLIAHEIANAQAQGDHRGALAFWEKDRSFVL